MLLDSCPTHSDFFIVEFTNCDDAVENEFEKRPEPHLQKMQANLTACSKPIPAPKERTRQSP
jgi:hypothetical protein